MHLRRVRRIALAFTSAIALFSASPGHANPSAPVADAAPDESAVQIFVKTLAGKTARRSPSTSS